MALTTDIAFHLKGVDKTATAFKGVTKHADAAAKQMRSAFAAVGGAIASALTVAKIKGSLDELNLLGDTAQRIGVSAEWLQKFSGAMGQFGIQLTATDIPAMLSKLNANMVNPEKVNLMRKLGIELKQFEGLAPEQAFEGLLTEISKVPDEQKRVMLLMRMMEEQGLKLGPLLRQGPDAFKEGLRDVMAWMPAVSNAGVDLATRTNNALALVSQNISTAFNSTLTEILGLTDSTSSEVELKIGSAFAIVAHTADVVFAKLFFGIKKYIRETAAEFAHAFKGWDAFKDTLNTGAMRLMHTGYLLKEFAKGNMTWDETTAAQEQFKAFTGQELMGSAYDSIAQSNMLDDKTLADLLQSYRDQLTKDLDTIRRGVAAKKKGAAGQATFNGPLAELETLKVQEVKLPEQKMAKSIARSVKDAFAAAVTSQSYDSIKLAFAASQSGKSLGQDYPKMTADNTDKMLRSLKDLLTEFGGIRKNLKMIGVV